jgi:hypothetical protein
MRIATLGAILLFAAVGSAGDSIRLPMEQIAIDTSRGDEKFIVEVASDPASQQRGLMFRRQLSPNAGMLFDFHRTTLLSFWMKDTFLPLDILFIRSDGTISTIASNTVPLSTAPIPSAEPVRAVLEINAGLARQLGIHAGDRIRAAIFHNAN